MKQAFQVLGVVLIAYWGVTHYQQIYVIRNGLNCLRQFKLICSSPTPDSELMDAVKTKTDPGAPILLSSGDYQWLSVRYYALRPLIYIWRDGGGLFYANELQLTAWVKLRDALDIINAEQDLGTRLNDLINFGRENNAQYVVTDFPADSYMSTIKKADLLYSNARGSLVAIR